MNIPRPIPQFDNYEVYPDGTVVNTKYGNRKMHFYEGGSKRSGIYVRLSQDKTQKRVYIEDLLKNIYDS